MPWSDTVSVGLLRLQSALQVLKALDEGTDAAPDAAPDTLPQSFTNSIANSVPDPGAKPQWSFWRSYGVWKGGIYAGRKLGVKRRLHGED